MSLKKSEPDPRNGEAADSFCESADSIWLR